MNDRFWRLRALAILLALATAALADGGWLDVHFEENHAGSYYYLAATLPLDEPHTLVHIDAHSDANSIPDSDRLRKAIREVPSIAARNALLDGWRRDGTVQCFDWIEPLMPSPISEVIWVTPENLSRFEKGRQQTLAREVLDGQIEAFPRECGRLGEKFRLLNRLEFDQRNIPRSRPVVVSLDLDYFATFSSDKLDAEFERIFSRILGLPGLSVLTISRSTPFLRDAAQADRLTILALDAVTGIANARVTFAPFATTGPDRSRRAKELAAKGISLPALDLKNAPPELRTLLLSRQGAGFASLDVPGAEAVFNEWRTEPFIPVASVVGEFAEPDGWHRLRAKTESENHLEVTNGDGAEVRWFALIPTSAETNVAGLTLGFSDNAPRWVRRVPKPIGKGPRISTLELHRHLGTALTGSALVFAEVTRDGERWRSNVLRLAFSTGSGFRSALSEQFAKPYAFGCGIIAADGPEKLVAADCANFLIAALRRDGWLLPWGNPKQFSEHLELLGESRDFAKYEPLTIAEADLDAGLFIHLGSHVAAVWEDRAPVGQLDPGDLVAHHLEAMPEIIPLASLMKTRTSFRLMRLKQPAGAEKIIIGGDVMLGRRVAEHIDAGADPFSKIAPILREADAAIVNLECVASLLGEPVAGKKFHFRAHPRAPEILATAGVDIVGTVNNHSGDFGPVAATDAEKRLIGAGLRCAGSQPTKLGRFSVFACETVTEPLLTAIRASGDSTVIVLPHWGTEHDPAVSEEQRQDAQRLIEAGADIIAGSGPHVRQPMTFEDGALIAWSLGNFVFDGPGPNPAWSRGALLEVTISPNGKLLRARELTFTIGNNGTVNLLPHQQAF